MCAGSRCPDDLCKILSPRKAPMRYPQRWPCRDCRCGSAATPAERIRSPEILPPFHRQAAAAYEPQQRGTRMTRRSTAAPKNQWQELFGKEPLPQIWTYIQSRLAYPIQALVYGGLKPETRARLQALGEQLDSGNAALRRVRAENPPLRRRVTTSTARGPAKPDVRQTCDLARRHQHHPRGAERPALPSQCPCLVGGGRGFGPGSHRRDGG